MNTTSAARAAPVQASSNGVSSAAGGDATAIVMEVLADKTGYDADMIEEDMELETELGIDSIKRVEILSGRAEQAWNRGSGRGRIVAHSHSWRGDRPWLLRWAMLGRSTCTTSAARAAPVQASSNGYPVQPEEMRPPS